MQAAQKRGAMKGAPWKHDGSAFAGVTQSVARIAFNVSLGRRAAEALASSGW